MEKTEILARMRQAFVERYKSGHVNCGVEFEIDLDRLIYAAFEAAQEPFVKQFDLLTDHAARTIADKLLVEQKNEKTP